MSEQTFGLKKDIDGETPRDPIRVPAGSTMDDRLLAREFYNANAFDITFINICLIDPELYEYTRASNKEIGAPELVCRPGEFVYLPHSFFTASWADKGIQPAEVIAVFNFGKEMFKHKKPNRADKRRATNWQRK